MPNLCGVQTYVLQIQLQDKWCWAAVASAVATSFSPAIAQCEVANGLLERADCCPDGSHSPGSNVTNYLDDALAWVRHFRQRRPGPIGRDEIHYEVCRSVCPVGVRVGWRDTGLREGHFVGLSGIFFQLDRVIIEDPWFGRVEMSRQEFTINYQGRGTWTHTYFTRP